MNLCLRNFKTLNALYTIKLSHQQCALTSLSSAASKQQSDGGYTINNGRRCRRVNNTVPSVNIYNSAKDLRCSFAQTRGYANISPKPAESEEQKLKSHNDGKDDDKQIPEPPEQSEKRTMPRLMNFPEIMWPSMLNSIKNWIMVHFIIRPYMDGEFNLRDFGAGAKKAMQVISSKLMNGDFAHLGNLITSDAINEMKPVIQKLSVSQRRQLEVKESDIYLTFPYQIGIMFDEDNEAAQKRWVEITMVFHVLRGFQEMRETGEEIPWNMGTLPEYQDRVFVCNYRFIKEFTKGQESDWTVNIVNHFKPIDLINEVKRH